MPFVVRFSEVGHADHRRQPAAPPADLFDFDGAYPRVDGFANIPATLSIGGYRAKLPSTRRNCFRRPIDRPASGVPKWKARGLPSIQSRETKRPRRRRPVDHIDFGGGIKGQDKQQGFTPQPLRLSGRGDL